MNTVPLNDENLPLNDEPKLWRDRRQRSYVGERGGLGMKKRVNTTTTRVLSADSIRVNGDDMMDGGGDYDEFSGDLPLGLNGEVSESDDSGDDHNISVENRNNTCGNFEDVDNDNNFGGNSILQLDSFDRLG